MATFTTPSPTTQETTKPTSTSVSFHDQHLQSPPFLLLPALDQQPLNWRLLQTLDLSCNELSALPGLEQIKQLTDLNISRNWFKAIPAQVVQLHSLVNLNARRNFLRPNDKSLALVSLATLTQLKQLDIQWNNKCKRQDWLDMLKQKLGEHVLVLMTVSFPAPDGSFVGASPAVRDAEQLRAQLEPWGTLTLRRRLVNTFSCPPTNPEKVLRAQVVQTLLQCYAQEGMMQQDDGKGCREIIHVEGVPIMDGALLNEILCELKQWVDTKRSVKQERPSVRAQNYMILRSPKEFEAKLVASASGGVGAVGGVGAAGGATKVGKRGSRKALLAKHKWEQHQVLWELATRAMNLVDVEFAETFTALAVTHNFVGSPHIDKQNIGPFYGMSLGNFQDGEGGICVEYDPLRIVQVNTKGRMGKVDGRFPHWVAPYNLSQDKGIDRYSLVYYQTEGEPTELREAVPGLVV